MNKANGGFPPIIKKTHKKSDSKNNINLKIKNILSDKIIKPMIETNKPKVEIVNDL